jgi:hypothetical protein
MLLRPRRIIFVRARESRENQGILPNLTFQPNFWLANRTFSLLLEISKVTRNFCPFSLFAWCSDAKSSFDPTQIGHLKVQPNLTELEKLWCGPPLTCTTKDHGVVFKT